MPSWKSFTDLAQQLISSDIALVYMSGISSKLYPFYSHYFMNLLFGLAKLYILAAPV